MAEERKSWMPIESAPKDGTNLLLWGKDGLCVGWFEHTQILKNSRVEAEYSHWLMSFPPGHLLIEPTHWMPLPDAPTIRENGRG